ncbi:MAG: tetratricopeptide repeat protein, partial [Thermoguttaceae bacterium]
MLFQRKDYQGAIDQWRYLLKRFPETANWHTNLGLVLEASGDVSGALAEFREASTINPYLRATFCYY